MNISVKGISFGFAQRKVFDNFSLEINAGARTLPLVILGPSGCGKTTLLRLIAGLIQPEKGEVIFDEGNKPLVSCVFQESRLLPHQSILKNIILPLEKLYDKNEAHTRAMNALKAVSLDDRAHAFPDELSGGQKQRASLARAFAYPSSILLMDEPFQSLDIPLRLALMDLTLSLLSDTKHMAIVITHDPREAVYMGSRIIVLGAAGEGIIFDEEVNIPPADRAYGSVMAGELERKLIRVLGHKT